MIIFFNNVRIPIADDCTITNENTISLETLHLKETGIDFKKESINTTMPKQYKTNIEELNLLGDNDNEAIAFNPPVSSSGFRIDSLNL